MHSIIIVIATNITIKKQKFNKNSKNLSLTIWSRRPTESTSTLKAKQVISFTGGRYNEK